ncbi:MAG: succinyldiaminopimelate transaminase [Gammaproteobacteria bacterium]|nr:succinyldiaminopimelate transaminase [Gammaproteobacteria bacterium]
MNPALDHLHPYPFEKLAALKAGITPADKPHIALSIGEPKHPAPALALNAFQESLGSFASYPLTKGTDELRASIAGWIERRFAAKVDPDSQIIPVSGTREALFAFAQAVIDRDNKASVLMPNPFYQIYEGAAILAGAQPVYLNTTAENGYLPDYDAVPEQVWRDCQLLYICSPGNPTGAVMLYEQLQDLIELAEKYDFIIASDECYSEIYPEENRPPAGLLSAAANMGNTEFKRCVVFHSLSKRSNLPGLRSGFVAGDAQVLAKFLKYRTYHGCALPLPVQQASIAAWNDETHVRENRDAYRAKFAAVLDILNPVLDVSAPDASFYLWPKLPVDDQVFAQKLFAAQNVTVLPGSFLSRQADGINPGQNHIRMALVASVDECIEAANRIKAVISQF